MVGPLEDEFYDNPSGDFAWGPLAFGHLRPEEVYQAVFDFGCGCGRDARRLMLQRSVPRKYLGADVSKPMVRWCVENLSPRNESFRFFHHDVYSPTYGPHNAKVRTAPLPGEDGGFTLFNAHSVFSHLFFDQAEFYLGEAKRLLCEAGIIRSTWFFFDKRVFPTMTSEQHCIFLQLEDPTQAVYYDVHDALDLFRGLGLAVIDVIWTSHYGFQTEVFLGNRAVYGDISGSLEIPDTVLGACADPARLWRGR